MKNKVEIQGRIVDLWYGLNKKHINITIKHCVHLLNHNTNKWYFRNDYFRVVVWGKLVNKAAVLLPDDDVLIEGAVRIRRKLYKGQYMTFTSIEAFNIKYSRLGSQYRDLSNGRFCAIY